MVASKLMMIIPNRLVYFSWEKDLSLKVNKLINIDIENAVIASEILLYVEKKLDFSLRYITWVSSLLSDFFMEASKSQKCIFCSELKNEFARISLIKAFEIEISS